MNSTAAHLQRRARHLLISGQKSAEKCREILSKKMEKAALLVAEDLLTDHEIASECGISNRTLYRWKKREEFIARVNTMVQAYSARVLGSGIAQQSTPGRDPEAVA